MQTVLYNALITQLMAFIPYDNKGIRISDLYISNF